VGAPSSGSVPEVRTLSAKEPVGFSLRSTLSAVVAAAVAPLERFADGSYAGRRLLGAAMILASSGLGVVALCVVAARATRPARLRRRRLREWSREAFGGGAYTQPENTEVRIAREGDRQADEHAAPLGPPRRGRPWRGGPQQGAVFGTPNGRRHMSEARHGDDDTTGSRQQRQRRAWRDHRRWEVGEPLVHLLEGMPLVPGAPSTRETLSELRPHVEGALRSVSLAEGGSNPLSEEERRQAEALERLWTSIESALDGQREEEER
jgi:hypothetical protein